MSRLRYRRPVGLLALAVLAIALAIALAVVPRLAGSGRPDPIAAAWDRVRAAGSYRFSSDIVQVTIPSTKVTNVGRTSRSEQIHLEGKADLEDPVLAFRLWSDGGSVLQDGSGIDVRVANGTTSVRQGTGDWQETSSFADAIAPQGDFMSYLVAVRDVTAHPPETRAGITFTRYSFRIDGPIFAAYVRDQLERALRLKGELPAGIQLDVPPYYRDMTGEGELWVGSNGLPLRQILLLQFPEQQDAYVNAQIKVDFSHFGEPGSAPAPLRLADVGQLGLPTLLALFPAHLPDLTPLLALGVLLLLLGFTVRFRRARSVQTALALALIASLLLSPLLNSLQITSFLDTQTAKAATQEKQLSESDMMRTLRELDAGSRFDPHRNPRKAMERRALTDAQLAGSRAAGASAPAVVLNALPSDDGTDSDQDGLTDFVEERVGTDPAQADTDGDLIDDDQEVVGFSYQGQIWYMNPLAEDSNDDSLSDTLEWDRNEDGQPEDTDGDGIPDLFDDDNDGDGVPDRVDLAPFARSGASFSEASPLQLTVNNLVSGEPTFVDFQVRPQNEDHLGFAFNVLDWPRNDEEGQIRDVDGGTYADLAAAQGHTAPASESFGDMKLLPMLEIRIAGDVTNLPPQADLVPYNVVVQDLKLDGSEKAVYVPLSVVTDEQTGARVAFSGRMRYLPAGNWPAPHEVRLVWAVQALLDMPCDPDTNTAGCAPDGYIHNQPQVVQTYYDEWTLTGLNVREDHGADVAILYEDPAVDPDQKDDAALWALTAVLDSTFLAGRDQEDDGVRDVNLNDIADGADHTRNSGSIDLPGSAAIPNVLRVEKQHYATFDAAMTTIAMTETKEILSTQFAGPWGSDNTLKPLLMYASEQTYRGLGLDNVTAGDGYVDVSDNHLTFDLQPQGQDPVSLDVIAGLQWTPYCAPPGTTPSWDSCDPAAYWQELDQRYAELAQTTANNDPNADSNPDVVAGQLVLAQFYNLALMRGVTRIVQRDAQVALFLFSLPDDTTLDGIVRDALTYTGPIVTRIAIGAVQVGSRDTTVLKHLGRWIKNGFEDFGTEIGQPALKALKGFTQNKIVRGAAIATSALLLVGGLATVVASAISSDPGVQLAAQIILRSVLAGLTLYLNVVVPIKEVVSLVRFATTIGYSTSTAAKAFLGARSSLVQASKMATLIGTVVAVALTWGFFIYSVAASGVSWFSPEFDVALAQTYATTLYLVLLAIISLTGIGLIIVGIIAVIDVILTAICELSADEARILDGACFTIGNAVIFVLTKLLYAFDVMIDTGAEDLVVTGSPQLDLAYPDKGFVTGNELSITLPITTHIRHKDPDPANGLLIYLYLWLFSEENLRSSTFRYSYTHPEPENIAVERNQMNSEWQNVEEDHKYILTPMYGGQDYTTPASPVFDLPPGVNRSARFYFNMGYAVPAYECWAIPNIIIPFTPPFIPVCYTRSVNGQDSPTIDAFKFDILPATLDGFMARDSGGDGGWRLDWDPTFRSLPDFDGDGLQSSAHNGLDPNDATWDSDGDGLSDPFELRLRQSGVNVSPASWDSDGDGLSDAQEIDLGTNPAIADTDNDGLSDSEEVWHQRYAYDNDLGRVVPTGSWEGGWDVTVSAQTSLTVRVSANPFLSDGDGDGVSDEAERQLAQDPDPARRVDDQNRPYHPNVFNTPPIAVYTSIDDTDGFVRPGQAVSYDTTVVATAPMAPSVLDVTVPPALGSSPSPYRLDFDPLTFTEAQTVTQRTDLTVQPNVGTQAVSLESRVRARLQDTGTPAWAWNVASQTALTPFGQTPRFVDVTAARPDRQDSFRLAALASDNASPGGKGDVWAILLPDGSTQVVDSDRDDTTSPPRLNNAFLRGATSPDVACNDAGDCMVVWDQQDNCNIFTIRSITIVSVGDDHGTSGIEPAVYFVADASDNDPADGGYQALWEWWVSASIDMQPGTYTVGLPVSRLFCRSARLEIYENDNNPFDERVGTGFILDPTNFQSGEVTFASNGVEIRLDVEIPQKHSYTAAGAIVGLDGTIRKGQFSLPTTNRYDQQDYRPVVASDGTGFLVAWERIEFRHGFPQGIEQNWVQTRPVLRTFDASGTPTTGEVPSPYWTDCCFQTTVPASRPYSMLTASWLGDRYRITERPPAQTFGANDRILKIEVARDGAIIDGSYDVLTGDVTPQPIGSHGMAYDPVTGRALLVYRTWNGSVTAKLYQGAGTTPINQQVLAASGTNPRAAYHPPSQGWLVSWEENGQLRFAALAADGTPLPDVQSGFSANANSSSLACPAPQSSPVVALPFEELPGATTFADSSGRGFNATCSGASCPAAGVSGGLDGSDLAVGAVGPDGAAVGTPESDFVLQFDGVDDALTLARPVQDDFSIALWIKAEPSSAPSRILVDGAGSAANGFTLWLRNGQAAIQISNASIWGGPRLDDGGWHFLVATRARHSGAVALYVDGNPTPVASYTFGTQALDTAPDLRIGNLRTGGYGFGGAMDELTIYPIALTAETIAQIYTRTLQSYCLAAGVAGNGVPWAQVRLDQQDVRGGRIQVAAGLEVTVDADVPSAAIDSLQDGQTIQGDAGEPVTLIIGGSAADPTSGIARVEVSVNEGPWQTADGAETWAYPLLLSEGAYTIQARAIDAADNVGAASPAKTVVVDATPPVLTIDLPATLIVPTQDADGRWIVHLSGTANDSSSGVRPGSVAVRLQGQDDAVPIAGWQTAVLNGDTWTLDYVFAEDLIDPNDAYLVTVRAEDNVGNRSTGDATLSLDGAGPEATLSQDDASRNLIASTLTLSGEIADSGAAGVDGLEVAFTTVEEVAPLADGTLADAAETQLNRTWHVATLDESGPGVATSAWSLPVPEGLEGQYQIDLRATDVLGNQRLIPNVWRGIVDTWAPRVVMTAQPSGAAYFDPAGNVWRHAVTYTCAAVDRHLNGEDFDCPGNRLQPPTRSFDVDPVLQELFPDWTVRDGLANHYTIWEVTDSAGGVTQACDIYGHCATASAQPSLVDGGEPGAPVAVIAAPVAGSYLQSDGSLIATVAAAAGQSLQQIEVLLDDAVVATLTFDQDDAVTQSQRTVSLTGVAEGIHTLAARASDWTGSVQQTLFPVSFTLDTQPPSITLDNTTITVDDTYGLGSDILRFHGSANDTIGIAAVQVRVGDVAFTDAIFADGAWRIALPVANPEGKTLVVTALAIDLAGRISAVSQEIPVDLTTTGPPDTTITAGPSDPSDTNAASFSFEGIAGARTVAGFGCQLDDAPFTPCTSPWSYSDLSKGAHTFLVRAIDAGGYVDPSPASYTWTVNAIRPETFITEAPSDPTPSREASFSFVADDTPGVSGFECALDGSDYSPCTSPQVYTELFYGRHTFLVRAQDANGFGTATRFTWTVVNGAPVAHDQVISTAQDQAKVFTLTASDGDPLSFQVVSSPEHGTLIGIPPNLTYVPNSGFYGFDSFTFRANDGLSDSNLATVHITVRLGQYVVLGEEGVALGLDTSVVSGDVGANLASTGPFLYDEAEIVINEGVTMLDAGSHLRGDSIVIRTGATVYNPSYNELDNQGTILGTTTTPLKLPLVPGLPPLPPINADTENNVDLQQSGSALLAPGSYGTLTIRDGATMTFSGGVYHFENWNIGEAANLYFQAASEVRIAGKIRMKAGSYLGPDPAAEGMEEGDIVLYVDGENGPSPNPSAQPVVDFNEELTLAAYVVAPNGTITVRRGTEVTGALVGKWVETKEAVRLALAGQLSGSSTGVASPASTPMQEETDAAENSAPAQPIYLPVVGLTGPTEAGTSVADDEPAEQNWLYLPLLHTD